MDRSVTKGISVLEEWPGLIATETYYTNELK